jgi:hypothetical protein
MSTRTRYQVLLARFDDWWCVEVPSLGVLAQCRSFGEAEQTARETIASLLDLPKESFDIAIELQSAVPHRSAAAS